MTTFRDLFIEHVGASLERQLDLEDKVGPCEWRLDLPGGTITFETRERELVVPMQVLGSEADASGMWVAAWSIDPSRMAPELAEASRRVRAIGEKERIPELVNAKVPLADADGERISLVASGLLAAPGYYRAPFRGGAMFVLLQDASLATSPSRAGVRIVEVFRRAADLLAPTEQRRALAAYARHHGADVTDESGVVRAAWRDETLTAKLGADGSVESFDVTP
jgi:hypothetical protein